MSPSYPTVTGLGDKDRDGPPSGREAAAASDAERIRAAVHAAYIAAGRGGLTADECAERLGLDELSVRPRVSELKKDGILVRTSERRVSAMRRSAAVLVAAQFLPPTDEHGDAPSTISPPQGRLL